MDDHRPLTSQQVQDHLAKLAGWKLADGELVREFNFKNFSEAFAFMTRVAIAAEKLNHHPDWSNSYSKVVIRLSTHQNNGITNHDVELAEMIQRIAS
jgi:4a-hydroxytetrahydrobiopterin dehydratase